MARAAGRGSPERRPCYLAADATRQQVDEELATQIARGRELLDKAKGGFLSGLGFAQDAADSLEAEAKAWDQYNCTLLERRFTTLEEQNSYVLSRSYWVRNYRDTRDVVKERVVKALTQQIAHLEALRGRLELLEPPPAPAVEPAPPRRSGPVNVNVYGGTFGQFNIDALVENIDTQIAGVQAQGQPAVAEALRTLATAFANARLPEAQRKEALENVELVAAQAAMPPRQRKGGWLRSALGYLREVAGAAEDVKQVWDDVEPVLMDVLPPG